jgi:hypothetical protein
MIKAQKVQDYPVPRKQGMNSGISSVLEASGNKLPEQNSRQLENSSNSISMEHILQVNGDSIDEESSNMSI